MYDKIVVPLDGSDTAARALTTAATLAAEYESSIAITAVVSPSFVPSMTENARTQAAAAGIHYPIINLVVSARSPAVQLIEALDDEPTSLLCMATTGRSHLGQVLGSVAEEVLRARTGPFLLVGPQCDPDAFKPKGKLIVPIDGSETSLDILPLAAAWSIAYGLEPEVVIHADPDGDDPQPALDAAAAKLEADIERPVSSLAIQGINAAEAVVARAKSSGAALIAMTTHGRTGLPRVVMGSITMDVVHNASCPVLVHRPLRLRT